MSKLNEVLDKARNSVAKTKTKVTNATAKNGVDKPVPGFSKYALDAAGQLVSRETGKVQQIPKGKKGYYLYNDKGERRTISMEEILKKTNTAPAPKPRAHADKDVPAERMKELNMNKTVQAILGAKYKKHETCYRLHLQGLTAYEIVALTGVPYNATKRNIWYYTSEQKTLK